MTKKEAAIVSAYTGIMLGSFSDLHEYVEKVLGRPIWTHQFADKTIMDEIKRKSKEDFINITIE